MEVTWVADGAPRAIGTVVKRIGHAQYGAVLLLRLMDMEWTVAGQWARYEVRTEAVTALLERIRDDSQYRAL